MSSVLIIDEIASDRQELARALEAEGFRVVQLDTAEQAVREIWEGSYSVVFIASILTGKSAQSVSDELQQIAPEIETVVYSKSDDHSRLVRKAIAIRDGVAAA